jgi:hypothetical protein
MSCSTCLRVCNVPRLRTTRQTEQQDSAAHRFRELILRILLRMLTAGCVPIFGRRQDEPLHALWRPAYINCKGLWFLQCERPQLAHSRDDGSPPWRPVSGEHPSPRRTRAPVDRRHPSLASAIGASPAARSPIITSSSRGSDQGRCGHAARFVGPAAPP